MKNNRKIVAVILFLLSYGCAPNNVLTKEELARQSAADYEVATILFNSGLSDTASYNIHKDGLVVIKFHKSVASSTYTDVVQTLRRNKLIFGVRAEQGGVEVCPLR